MEVGGENQVEVDVEVQVGVMPDNVTVHYECTNTDTDIDLQPQSSKEKTTRWRFASQAGLREHWFVLSRSRLHSRSILISR
jgi:hypothetical protein